MLHLLLFTNSVSAFSLLDRVSGKGLWTPVSSVKWPWAPALPQDLDARRELAQEFECAPYKPLIWAKNNNINTILGSGDFQNKIFGEADVLPYERIRFTLPDTDFVDVDMLSPKALGATDADMSLHQSALVIILHGLEGSSRAPLTAAFSESFGSLGFSVAAINFRGCSGTPSKKQYHLGYTDDLKYLVPELIKRGRHQRVYLVGFSLGANVVVKFLGEQQENAVKLGICGAAVACVPFVPAASSVSLSKSIMGSYIYVPSFLSTMKSKALAAAEIEQESKTTTDTSNSTKEKKSGILAQLKHATSSKNKNRNEVSSSDAKQTTSAVSSKIDVKALEAAKSIDEFNDLYTVPVFGFKDRDDYYNSVCATTSLKKIAVPTLIMNAYDDPFTDRKAMPDAVKSVGKAPVQLKFYDNGGHCGFLTSRKDYTREPSKTLAKQLTNVGVERFLPPELCRFVLHIEDSIIGHNNNPQPLQEFNLSSINFNHLNLEPVQQLAYKVNTGIKDVTAAGRKLMFAAAVGNIHRDEQT